MKKFIMRVASGKGLLRIGLSFLAGLTFSMASMADLDIPNTPLFLTSVGVRPNVILTFDDSLSMALGWVPERIGNDQALVDGPRFKSASVNGMYYDPQLTYPIPQRSDGTSYTTSFNNAYFNGFDPSRNGYPPYGYPPLVVIDLQDSYKVVGQAAPSQFYRNCTSGSGFGFGCEFVKHPVFDSGVNVHTATCTVNAERIIGDDRISIVGGGSSCNQFFSGITPGTSLTLSGSPTFWLNDVYEVTSSPSTSQVLVNHSFIELPFFGSVSTTATLSWQEGDSEGGDYSGVPAYYYLYYADKDGEPIPDGCDNSRDTDACYVHVVVGSSADIANGSPDEQKQNFANWYSFYRTRALAMMSSAMSAVDSVPAGDLRLGWQTLNVCDQFAQSDCQGYDYVTRENRLRTLTDSYRSNFFGWLARLNISGATPLRSALQRAGEYFQISGMVDSPYAEDPYVTLGTEHSCRRNFHIMFTDGLWNRGMFPNEEPRHFDSPEDLDSSGSVGLPDGEIYSPRAPFRDVSVTLHPSYDNENSLADFAFEYWANDLNTSLENNVPNYVTDRSGDAESQYWNPRNDPATWQHMTNYMIGLGLSASLTPECYFDPDRGTPDPNSPNCPLWGGSTFAGDYDALSAGLKNWPRINQDPTLTDEPDGHVYDLWHAAINSRGRFYSANNPADLVAAFQDVLDTITSVAASGGGSGLGANTTQINQEGAIVFEARFNEDWSGQLLARPALFFSTETTEPYYWDAAELIPSPPDRDVFTMNGSEAGAAQPFNSCSGDLATALNQDAEGVVDNLCDKRLNWLRGDGKITGATSSSFADDIVTATFTVEDHGFVDGDKITISDVEVQSATSPGYNGTFEIAVTDANTFTAQIPSTVSDLGTYVSDTGRASYAQFRDRPNTVLGDIINSDPVYVSEDDFGYGGGSSAVTVTARDTYGAFLTAKGSLPPMIYAGANDGMLHGFRADIGNAESGVELLAYVPNGVYDHLSELTDPGYSHRFYVDGPSSIGDAYIGSNWGTYLVGGLGVGGKSIFALDITDPEGFSEDDVLWEFTDTDLGLTYGRPQIAAITSSEWAAIFSNGYNIGDPSTGTDDLAYLFVVDLASGAQLFKIRATSDPDNGLSTPHLYDSDGDKIIDVAYAGDLQGNLWKFVNNAGTWSLGNGLQPLFTARNDDNDVQPITSEPKVAAHPNGGVLIYFGTGSYLSTDDLTNDDQQSFYAIWDKGLPGGQATVTRDDLQSQSILTEESAEGFTVRTTSQETVDWITQWGWYLDLPATSGVPSERVVTTPLILQFTDDDVPDRVLFVTNTPAADPCSRGGTTWLMELDLITGGRTLTSVFDLTGEGEFTDEDTVERDDGEKVTVSGVALPDEYGLTGRPLLLENEEGNIVKLFSGSTGVSGTAEGPLQRGEQPTTPGGGSLDRVYWQQIF